MDPIACVRLQRRSQPVFQTRDGTGATVDGESSAFVTLNHIIYSALALDAKRAKKNAALERLFNDCII